MASEVLVIGAGVIGSSVAMHLAQAGVPDVRVVDFDLEGTLSSSELNAGGVRGTWFQPVNITASRISIDYFASVSSEVGYRPCGYLWLRTPEKLEWALKARELQQSLGWPVEAWDLAELKRRVPFLDKLEGVAGAIYGPRDGLINPNLLKNHFRARAREAGVVFEDRIWIHGAEYSASQGPGGAQNPKIRVRALKYPPALNLEQKQAVLAAGAPSAAIEAGARPVEFKPRIVVNCAGPWAPEIARVLGYDCPSRPVRRQICVFDSRDVDLSPYGMMIDTSGVYFHPEAMNGMAGFADPAEPAGKNFSYDGESFFMNVIWPALYERSSAFERLRHLTGWSGLYESSPDESAIVGRVEKGDAGRHGGVFEAHSFSGHGVMHSHAVGLAIAERVARGRYESWDASPLSAERFPAGRLLKESLVI